MAKHDHFADLGGNWEPISPLTMLACKQSSLGLEKKAILPRDLGSSRKPKGYSLTSRAVYGARGGAEELDDASSRTHVRAHTLIHRDADREIHLANNEQAQSCQSSCGKQSSRLSILDTIRAVSFTA